jgi:hypothetical protein
MRPCWRSFVGALSGALAAIDKQPMDLVEIAGRTGFAFYINIHTDLCPSGPTAFPNDEVVRKAFDQVGWDYERYFSVPSDNTFSAVQRRAIAGIEAGITRGVPAIVWGIGVPEYALVTGFDSEARRFTVSTIGGEGMDAKGLAYGEVGLGPVSFLEVMVPREKAGTDETRVAAEALRMAVNHALGGTLRYRGYTNGLAAYGLWMEALREGRAEAFGMAYNTQVYAEARKFAKEYLADLVTKDLVGATEALGEAAECYERVADNLGTLAEAFPFAPSIPREEKVDKDKAAEAAALLERALFWEHSGVEKLQKVLEASRAG